MYIYFHRRWTSIFLMHGNRRVTALTWCIAQQNLQMLRLHMITFSCLHPPEPNSSCHACRTMPAPCFPQEALWDPYDLPVGRSEDRRKAWGCSETGGNEVTWDMASSPFIPETVSAGSLHYLQLSLRKLQAAVPLPFLISITLNNTISLQGKK